MESVNERVGCWAYRTEVRRITASTGAERWEPRYAISDGALRRSFLAPTWDGAVQQWLQARGAAFGGWAFRGVA